MIDFENKNSVIMFLFGIFLLGTLNIFTYPYLPFTGVLMTLFFMFLSLMAVILGCISNQSLSFFWIVFSSFNFTVLLSRVFVNTIGIGTPKSTGRLGFFVIEQLWIRGFHLHHYWLGFFLLFIGFYMLNNQFSRFKTAAFLGTGLGLVFDELGIILAGQTYHSSVSYISLVVMNTFLFLLHIKSEDVAALFREYIG